LNKKQNINKLINNDLETRKL